MISLRATTSSGLLKHARRGAWALGSCLIVSAFLRPEVAFQATDHLADLFLGTPQTALDSLMWVVLAMAGVGLLAGRREACFLVYVAYLYSLIPLGPEFPVFPVTPVVKALLGGQNTADGVAVHALNGLFVLAVVGVHAALAKTSVTRFSRLLLLVIVSGIAASLALMFGCVSVLLFSVWRSALPETVNPITVAAYLILLGVPLAVWGVPSFVAACVRLLTNQRTRPQLRDSGEGIADGPAGGIVVDRGPVRAFQFTLASLLVTVVFVGVLFAVSVSMWKNATRPRRYERRFQETTAWADRVVVRDGGFDCCSSVDNQAILFEVTDSLEIGDLRRHIQFVPGTPEGECMCCGYPGLDWYRGGRRLALTSVHHGHALRWKSFPADVRLTDESSKWLCDWLKQHGLTDEQLR